jgi:hypothetical protein
MAEQVISPGVFINEDIPTITEAAAAPVGAAVVGPTPLGPVHIPTVCTTFSDFQSKFGTTFESGGVDYSYLTSIAAYKYFQQGGTNLLVTRVVSGSATAFTQAQSSLVRASGSSTNNVFTLKTFSQGKLMNSTSSVGAAVDFDTLESGSRDNLRWEITNRDESKGTFTLSIRQGNDTSGSKKVLETFRGVNLDPNSDNYIEKRIGNQYFSTDTDAGNTYVKLNGEYVPQSAYVYVSNVALPTPNYLNSAGTISNTAYTSSIPNNQHGAFGGATGDLFDGEIKMGKDITVTNMQGLIHSDYATAVNILEDQDLYYFNTISYPGYITTANAATTTTMINLSQNRGDNIAVLDLGDYSATPSDVVSEAENYDSSYVASYYPWVFMSDPQTGAATWCPASTIIPSVYVYNDEIAGAWFAPAGSNRSTIRGAISLQRALTKTNRDTLYDGKVNPIVNLPQTGIAIYGQKTLQAAASATDRVNVRRLLLNLKNFIGTVAQGLVFEPNSLKTRNSFLSTVVPYLDLVQKRQGLYAYKVVMDDSNNGPDVIDRNELRGAIYIQPVKAAEFVILDFNVLPTGAEFPS